MGDLTTKAMSTIVYFILQMPNTEYNETEQFDFMFDEIGDFVEIYQTTINEKDIELVHALIREELTVGMYLNEGLDSFTEGLAIFFRDKVYSNHEHYKEDPLYSKIIDIAEEVYGKREEQ